MDGDFNAIIPSSTGPRQSVNGLPTKVYFYGRLRKKFGAEHVVGAENISSIIRILLILNPGLHQELQQGRYRIVRGKLRNADELGVEQLSMRMGRARELHIFPVAAGNKNGIGKDIVGALLIVVAVAVVIEAGPIAGAIYGAGTAAATAGAATLTSIAFSVGLMGVSLLLGGISEAISPQPGLGQSYLLNGQINTSAQGVAVPLVYGTCRVGTVLVSSSYSAEDYTTATSDFKGTGAFNNGSNGNTGALKAFDSGNPLPSGAMGKGGGGKGGGSQGGIEAPNTLESKAVVRLIHVLSEGPIGGLVNGPQSMFFGSTPLASADGNYNFRGVAWQMFTGTPDQAPVAGFASITETTQVGIQVFGGSDVIQTLISDTADRCRVTVTVPALFATNTQNGDTNPTSIHLQIVLTPSGGAASIVVDDVINGKCTSAYQRSYVFALPNIGTVANPTTSWDVQINKITPDSAVGTTQNLLYWATYDLITDHQLTYGDTAYMALTLDSEAFGSSLPTFTVELNGIECSVPANYTPPVFNPATRVWAPAVYASTGTGTSNGTWDGVTFHAVTTSNPCWVLYDFISNARYGLGLTAAQLETVKYQLYTIGQYADGNPPSAGNIWQMIADGFGGFEPRYALNGSLGQQADAFSILQAIASTFRGIVYWAGGQVNVAADTPQTPTKILNQADVIDGTFTYRGTSLKTRHTWANVQWQDPEYLYLPAYEPVELPQQVALRGIFTKSILAFGCTSRGLARRLGLWLLYTENFQTDTVAFKVTYDKMDILPGNIIAIADSYYAGVRMGGRTRAGSTLNVVNLDMVFTPVAGQNYSLLVTYPDNTLSAPTPVSNFVTTSNVSAPYVLGEDFTNETAISSSLWNFSRASVATYFDQFGVMQQAAAGQPRFNHAPITAPLTAAFVGVPATAPAAITITGNTVSFVGSGAGGDDNGSDTAQYAYVPVTGNFIATAQVALESANGSKTGLMIRDSLVPNGCSQINAHMNLQAGGPIIVGWADFATSPYPSLQAVYAYTAASAFYVRIQRVGNTVTFSYSYDNVTWTVGYTLIQGPLNATLYIGAAFFDAGVANSVGVIENLSVIQSLGMLMEPASTNLVYNNTVIAGNLGHGSDWTLSASTAVPALFPGVQVVEHTLTATQGDNNAGDYGIPAAVGTVVSMAVWLWIPSGSQFTLFQFRPDNFTGPITMTSPANLALTNQWQRITGYGTASVANPLVILEAVSPSASGNFYTTLWQTEDGENSTSDIITSGSQVTRAADALSALLGPNYTEIGGTILYETLTNPVCATGSNTVTLTNSTTPTDYVQLSASSLVSGSIKAGATTTSLISPPWVYGQPVREAVSWSSTRFQQASGGYIIDTITNATMPAVNLNEITFNCQGPFHLRQFAFYPQGRNAGDLANISSLNFLPSSEASSGTPYTQLLLTTPLTQVPEPNAVFILTSLSVAATQWQVVGISESHPGEFDISAVQYDINKFTIIENDLTFNIPSFSNLAYVVVTTLPATPPMNPSTGSVATLVYDKSNSTFYEYVSGVWQATTAPTGQTIQDQLLAPIPAPYNISIQAFVIGTGTTTLQRLAVSWTSPTDTRIANYQIAVVNAEGVTVEVVTANGSSIDIDGLSPGVYSVGIRALARTGSTSSWAYSSQPVNVTAVPTGPMTDPATGTLITVVFDTTNSTYYQYVNGAWVASATPPGTVVTGQSNYVPDEPTNFTATGSYGQITLSWTPSVQRDVATYQVWRGSNNTTPGVSGATAVMLATTGGAGFVDSDAITLMGNGVAPFPTWYYFLRSVTTTNVLSPFVGPIAAATTQVLGSDIATAAITSSLFANNIQPVGLWDNATLPTSLAQTGGTTVFYDLITNLLYKWNGSAFVNTSDASSLTTGTLGTGVSVPGSQVAGALGSGVTLPGSQVSGQINLSSVPVLTAAQIGAGSITPDAVTWADSSNIVLNPTFTINGQPSAAGWGGGLVATATPTLITGTWYNGTSTAWNPSQPGYTFPSSAATTATTVLDFELTAGNEPWAAPVTSFPAGVNANYVYADFIGTTIAPLTGTYTIGVNSDDGANVIVNGVTLVSNLGAGQGAGADLTYTQSGTITLTQGQPVTFEVQYQQGSGNAGIQLLWTPPGATGPSLVTFQQSASPYAGAVTGPNGVGAQLPDLAVEPGDTFYASFQVLGFNVASFNLWCAIYDAAGNASYLNLGSLPPLTGQWQTYSGQITMPQTVYNGGVPVKAFFYFPATPVSGNCTTWITQVILRKAASAELLVPGSISASNLAIAGAIINGQTNTGILSEHLAPNAGIIAAQIASVDAGAINGAIQDAQIAGLNASKLAGSITAATLPVAQLSGQITGNQILADTITANQIAAGTVTAQQIDAVSVSAAILTAGSIQAGMIAAGTITASELSISSPSNSIWNSCLNYATDGWINYNGTFEPLGSSVAVEPVTGDSFNAFSQGVYGGGVVHSFGAANFSAYTDIAVWSPPGQSGSYGASTPVVPGNWYAAQVKAIAHGCQVGVFLIFSDDAGNITSAPTDNAPYQEPEGRFNLSPNSNVFVNAYGANTITTGYADSFGGTGASQIAINAQYGGGFAGSQTASIIDDGQYVGSIYLRADTAQTVTLYSSYQNTKGVQQAAGQSINLTTGWQRFTVVFPALLEGAQTLNLQVNCPASAGNLYAYGMQIERGTVATNLITTSNGPVFLAPALADWPLIWCQGQAPAGTALVGLLIRAYPPPIGNLVLGYTETASPYYATIGSSIILSSATPGGDCWQGSDQGIHAWQSVTGDFVATCQVEFSGTPASFTKAGLMVRDTMGELSCTQVIAGIYVTGSSGFSTQWANFSTTYPNTPDQNINGAALGAANYVKIERVGNTLTFSYSTDNATWTVYNTLTPTYLNRTLFLSACLIPNTGKCSAAFANLIVDSSAWVAWTQASLGDANQNATTPPPWVPGGTTQLTGGMLLTNSITANQIAAGTITAAKINTASISAAILTADSITAGMVAAGSIIASKLTLTDVTNLISNPLFQAGTGGTNPDNWSTSDAPGTLVSMSSTNSAVPVGASALTVMQSTARGAVYNAGQLMPVTPGDTYYLAIDYAGNPTNEIAIGFFAYNASGSIISYPIIGMPNAQTAWQTGSGQITIGAGVYYVQPFILNGGPNSTLLPAVYFTRMVIRKAANASLLVDGSITSATIATGTITSTQVQPGSLTGGAGGSIASTTITGGNIATQTITAANIASNTISTQQLDVGFGNNVIANPSCVAGTFGWTSGATSGITLTFTNNLAGYYPPSEGGCGTLFAPSIASGTNAAFMAARWDPYASNGISVLPGQWIEVQAMLAAQRCAAQVTVNLYDTQGTLVEQAFGNRIVSPGGTVLTDYGLSYAILQIPTGNSSSGYPIATAVMAIHGFNDGGTDFAGDGVVIGGTTYNAGQNCYVEFLRASLAPTSPGATQPSQYQPGGLTSIKGGWIEANSITANQIAAGTITADRLVSGSITTQQLDVAEVLTATNIQAGVLGAGVILGNDAFFTGTVQIKSADIGALQVGTSNIANNATSLSGGAQGTTIASVTVNVPSGYSVFAIAYYVNQNGTNGYGGNLKRDSTVSLAVSGFVEGSIAIFDQPSAGSHTYSISALSGQPLQTAVVGVFIFLK